MLTNPISHVIHFDGIERVIHITPVIQRISGGNLYATGVFKLKEGSVGMGEIVFDDDMRQWEYTGIGELTHEEAGMIADFIKNYKEKDTYDI
jgi:hypothetical protein